MIMLVIAVAALLLSMSSDGMCKKRFDGDGSLDAGLRGVAMKAFAALDSRTRAATMG